MELDRVLIDCIPEALTIEDLEKLISKTIKKAADSAIPKTKPTISRNTNYPLLIVGLIAHKRRLLQYYRKTKINQMATTSKASKLNAVKRSTNSILKNGTNS